MPTPPRLAEPPSPPTTVGEQLAWATHVLEAVGVREPAVEAATLLAAAMDMPRAAPAPDPAAPLAASQVDRLLAAIARRLRDGRRSG
jgi:hypothetical protein